MTRMESLPIVSWKSEHALKRADMVVDAIVFLKTNLSKLIAFTYSLIKLMSKTYSRLITLGV